MFQQTFPTLSNQYIADDGLQKMLLKFFSAAQKAEMNNDFIRFGELVATKIDSLAKEAESNEPYLIKYDSFGHQIDEIKISSAWKELKRISAIEGLVAIPYEKNKSSSSRLIQMIKIYMFSGGCAVYSCPLAMTDGAAHLLQDINHEIFQSLTSRDPEKFWTSGQWMTEKIGGSDVSNIETEAIKTESGYELNGLKWFTSSTDSDMAIVLAKIKQDGNLDMVKSN